MFFNASMLALAGLGDLPDLIVVLAFCIGPFHIRVEAGVTDSAIRLVGNGPAAVILGNAVGTTKHEKRMS
jgi:hypothetical protein